MGKRSQVLVFWVNIGWIANDYIKAALELIEPIALDKGYCTVVLLGVFPREFMPA